MIMIVRLGGKAAVSDGGASDGADEEGQCKEFCEVHLIFL